MARPSAVMIRIHANAIVAGEAIRVLHLVDENVGKKPVGKGKKPPPPPPAGEPSFKLDELTEEAAVLVDEQRQIEMKKRGMAPARVGRGDTGVQVFGPNGVANGEISQLVKDLVAAGYAFVDAHYREQPMFDRQTGRPSSEKKTVITFVFSREADEEPQEADFLKDVITYFAGRPFRTIHVWQNDNGDTVNLAGGYDPNVGKYKHLHFNAQGEYSVEEVVKPRHARAERNA